MNSVESSAVGCVSIVAFPIWIWIGAGALRSAVSVYNTLAGGESSTGVVQLPSFGQAAKVVFAITLIYVVAGLFILAVAPPGTILPRPKPQFSNYLQPPPTPPPQKPNPLNRAIKQYLCVVCGFLITTRLLSGMLSLTLVRASVVTACFLSFTCIPLALLLAMIGFIPILLK